MTNWRDIVVKPDFSLRETIELIDRSALQVALVLDDSGRLMGILTDGDIRRAILRGEDMQVPTRKVMNVHAKTASAHTRREELMAIMRGQSLHHLPLVDENRCVVGLATLDDLTGAIERPNWVVLMAGGMGVRLRPLTEHVPKPLLIVDDKPILQTIIESFAGQGFRRFFISINYKADMILEHFGDGTRWGISIEYLHETTRLGTAGALSLLTERPSAPLIVMNGDLLTRTNFDSLLQFHTEQCAAATMAVREFTMQVPFGVVQFDGTRISSLSEKPVQCFFVNAGIYVLSPEVLNYLPAGEFIDMPDLFERSITAGEKAVAYPLREYWLDIGRLEELERAQREWRN